MTVPSAPLSGGDKILFIVFDSGGTLTPALLRGIASATVDGEIVAHLAVATHADADSHGSNPPILLIGGSDGTYARKVLVDTSGRQIVSGEVVDNAGYTDGTSRVLPAGFIFDEVAGTALTENDAAASRIDS